MANLSLLLISSMCILFKAAKCDDSSLVLVHCLFKHGNQTVESPTYSRDPYVNKTYYPFGYGQLTNGGRLREFNLGVNLRNRYDNFLGYLWTPEVLDSLSVDSNKAKMSLQLVLAGLYPPAFTPLAWSGLNWQPIPYNYVDKMTDHILVDPILNCPKYIKLYNKFLSSSEGKTIQNRYAQLFQYLTENTGENFTTNAQVLDLYRNLVVQEDWGFVLPSWAKPVYPKILEEAGGHEHVIATYTDKLRRLAGGFLLNKIIQDTEAKISGTLIQQSRKLFLYSAHDTNIAQLLGTLKVLYPHNPSYSSFVLFELHKIRNEYGFKLFYQNYEQRDPVLLKIPNCEDFCSFKKFVRLTSDLLPKGDNPCGIEIEE